MSLAWRFSEPPAHREHGDRVCVDCGLPLLFDETERCAAHARARRQQALDDVGRDLDHPVAEPE